LYLKYVKNTLFVYKHDITEVKRLDKTPFSSPRAAGDGNIRRIAKNCFPIYLAQPFALGARPNIFNSFDQKILAMCHGICNLSPLYTYENKFNFTDTFKQKVPILYWRKGPCIESNRELKDIQLWMVDKIAKP
jgi:hypothetical protein